LRDFLTILAVIVILALVTALGAPYAIDWDSRRGEVEAALSEALGAPVRTGGGIAVRLLPAPVLELDQVDLGGNGDEPGLTAGRLSVELAVAPLLKGEFRVVEASLDNPVLTVVAAADGSIALPRFRPVVGKPASIAIERLTIDSGTIRFVDRASGGQQALDGLSLTLQSNALTGPWRVEGVLGARPLRVSTGELDAAGSLRIKLTLGDEANGRIEADGVLSIPVAPGGEIAPAFNGKVQFGATLAPATANRPALVLAANAIVASRGRVLTSDALEIEAGEAGRTIKVAGTARVDLGDRPLGELALSAKRIDLDETGATLASLAGDPDSWQARLDALPLPVALNLSVASLAYEGEEATGVEAAARLADGRIGVQNLTAKIAGDTTLAFAGKPDQVANGGVAGRFTMASAAPARLSLALARLGLASSRAEALAKLPDLSLDADVIASPTLVAMRNLKFVAGKASVTGAWRYTPPEGAERGRFEAQIAADGLDLGSLPDAGDLSSAIAGLDVGLTLDARRVRVGDGTDVGRLGIRLAAGADGIAIEALDIAGLSGATVKASGRIGASGDGRIDGTLDAARAAPVLVLLDKLGVGGGIATALPSGLREGPLRMTLMASGAGAGDARRVAVDVAGTASELSFGGTLTLGGERGGTLDDLALDINAPEAAGVVRRLGFVPSESAAILRGLPSLGPMQASVKLARRDAATRDLSVSGTVSGVKLTTEIPLQIRADGKAAAEPARLSIATADAGPLGRRIGLILEEGRAYPLALTMSVAGNGEVWRVGLAGRAGEEPVKGEFAVGGDGRVLDGVVEVDRASLPALASLFSLGPVPAARAGTLWPATRFAAAPDIPFGGAVVIATKVLDLGAGFTTGPTRLTLMPVADGVTIAVDPAAFEGGKLAGALTLKRQGGNASVSGEVGLDAVRIEGLTRLAPGTGLTGRVSTSLRFGGSGESIAAIVANLAGGGRLAASDVALRRFDGEALQRVAVAAVNDPGALDARRLASRVSASLDAGAFAARPIDVPLTASAGVLRLTSLTMEAPGAVWQGSVALDLKTLALDASGILVSRTSPSGWTGQPPQASAAWRGSVLSPRRDVDASAFANGLAGIQLLRELERIESFEADARERAAHNRRLKAEREQRAAEARAAEEARRAEEARLLEEARLAEETRRVDEARRIEEARLVDEARRAEEARLAAEARRVEEAKRQETLRQAEEARRAEAVRRAEEASRIEAARRAEEARRDEARRQVEEARRLDEARRLEEARRAEEARQAAEARRVEDAKRAEEARLIEEAKRLDESRRAEEAKRAKEEARLRADEERRRLDSLRIKAIIDGVSPLPPLPTLRDGAPSAGQPVQAAPGQARSPEPVSPPILAPLPVPRDIRTVPGPQPGVPRVP